jgi:diazepam-binding inhibitor (GABA receptor modulating acyl-CoA-binding protein)
MDLDAKFADAAERVKTLSSRPGNDVLLDLYALYKQGSEGDAGGKRPGAFDLKGRAKYDAWAKRKGMGRDAAKEAYVALVDKLAGG